LNSLGHEKWMSRILKITYYVYIACAVDSHWNIILYIYINVSLSMHLRIIHAACHWPQINENMDENSIRGSSEAGLLQLGWIGHASLHCVPGKSRESLVTCAKIS
jgi:hypothetical protein